MMRGDEKFASLFARDFMPSRALGLLLECPPVLEESRVQEMTSAYHRGSIAPWYVRIAK
jgi:hypothetical protein